MKYIIFIIILILISGCAQVDSIPQNITEPNIALSGYVNCVPDQIIINNTVSEELSFSGIIREVTLVPGTKSEWAYNNLKTDIETLIISEPEHYWGHPFDFQEIIDKQVQVKGYRIKPPTSVHERNVINFLITEIKGYSKKCCNKRYSENRIEEFKQEIKKLQDKIPKIEAMDPSEFKCYTNLTQEECKQSSIESTKAEIQRLQDMIDKGYNDYRICLWLED